MSEPYLLGIDLGTSSLKVLVVGLDGRVAAWGAAESPILHAQPLHAEQDPHAWWEACVQAVRAALAGVPRAEITAIGLSGQMHGVVMLDRAQNLVAPAIIWPDQRSQRQVQEITERVGAEHLYAITGSPLSTGFLAASVRWMQQEAPATWAQVQMLLLPKDYLRWRMTGVFATDPSDGAGALLLDEQQRDWSDELLRLLNLDRSHLPLVQPSDQIAGYLVDAAAAQMGLPAGIPIVTGAADTPCGLLGAGAVASDRLLLSISTGGQLVQPVHEVRVDRLGRIHTFCSALAPEPQQAGWYQMGATLNAGMALRWLRDGVLGWHYPDAYDVMNVAAENSPPGAQGLLFLPYLVGERSPHMDPTARGAFFGLTLRHGQGDLVRAVMEGATFACYDAYQVLAELGVQSQSVILAGGGAKSTLWRQIVADVFGKPVQPLLTSEQSALGAVLLAGGGAGLLDIAQTARRWAQLGPATEPDRARHAFYRDRFGAFQALYARNRGYLRVIYTVSTNPALDLILTVPTIEFEVVLRAYEVRREMGGKGFNVSRYLKALGVDNVAVAFAGGFTGQALEAGLQRACVATDFIYLDGETRTNVVIQEPGAQRHIKANQPGATVTPVGKAAFWDLLHGRAQPDDLWVLTGSLAPGLEADFYAEVSEELQRAGARVVLDTSGPALRRGCAARPLLVKPNVVEAEEFTGLVIRSVELAAAAATAFLDAGAQNVILSMGKDGAIVAGDGELLHLQPPPVTVKTAVGAGDAVVAGAVWALLQGLPARTVGLWGVATGTVTAMHDDLQPQNQSELDAIMRQVSVRVLP